MNNFLKNFMARLFSPEWLSRIAVILAAATFFFQFFHSHDNLIARVLNFRADRSQIEIAVALTNAGNRDGVIFGVEFIAKSGASNKIADATDVEYVPILDIPTKVIGDLPVALAPGKTSLIRCAANIDLSVLKKTLSLPSDKDFLKIKNARQSTIQIVIKSMNAIGEVYIAMADLMVIQWTPDKILETRYLSKSIQLFESREPDSIISLRL
jgi:hypothetical protein